LGSSCNAIYCREQRRKCTRALAYALARSLVRAGQWRRDGLRASSRRTPRGTSVRALFAAGDTPHEVISLLLYIRCPERVQELRTATSSSLLAFGGFCICGSAPQALKFHGRPPRAEDARVLHWNWPARPETGPCLRGQWQFLFWPAGQSAGTQFFGGAEPAQACCLFESRF
jgi:hypothetical protein